MSELFTLQFLRPYWLLALLPIVLLLWKIWQIKQKQGAWHQVIAPQFRSLLLGESQQNSRHSHGVLALIGLTLIWLLTILALAGPSTQTVEMPAQKNQQGTVIILDLSLSMLADDVPPNRLARAKYKITDLLTQHPEISVGLVGYANSAHTISPISEDNQTLLNLLPALNPVVMPSYGSNPILGFQKADQLFKGSQINHGHIIWITDDIEPYQVPQIEQWIEQHNYSIRILTVGTSTGGAVHIPNYGLLKDDNDNIISPPLPLERFNAFTNLSRVNVSHLTLNDQSLTMLMPPALSSFATQTDEQKEKRLLIPLDQGVYLLILLLPLVALLFRRGWLLSVSTLSLPLIGLLSASLISVGLFAPNTSYAEGTLPSLSDAFKSPDQQGYQAWENNNLDAAASLFENEQWRASVLYKQGKYQEAAKLFRQDTTPTGYYNLGNALAKSGDFKGAKTAYETALQQKPDFEKAKKNLMPVKQLLAKQEQDKKKQQNKQQEKQDSKQQTEQDQNNQSEQTNSADQSSKESKPSETGSDEKSSNSDQTSQTNNHSKDKESNELNNESALQKDKKERLKKEDSKTNKTPSSEDEKEALDDQRTQDSKSSEAHQNQTERDSGKLSNQKNTLQDSPMAEPSSLTPKEQEKQRAIQNWLNQIPDEPALFLEKKFEHQYQQQSIQPNPNSKQW